MVGDKRGRQLVPKRPRSLPETIFGIVGGVATFAWIFEVCLKIIDAVGRVQTVMALGPYAHYLDKWWIQPIELVAAAIFIVLATRIEQSRETEDAPKIILLETREPTPIKRDWLWMKVALSGTVLAALAAGGVSLVVQYHKHISQQQTAHSIPGGNSDLRANPVPQASAGQLGEPTQETKARAANPPKNDVATAPSTVRNKSTPGTSKSTPIVIPIPD